MAKRRDGEKKTREREKERDRDQDKVRDRYKPKLTNSRMSTYDSIN